MVVLVPTHLKCEWNWRGNTGVDYIWTTTLPERPYLGHWESTYKYRYPSKQVIPWSAVCGRTWPCLQVRQSPRPAQRWDGLSAWIAALPPSAAVSPPGVEYPHTSCPAHNWEPLLCAIQNQVQDREMILTLLGLVNWNMQETRTLSRPKQAMQ